MNTLSQLMTRSPIGPEPQGPVLGTAASFPQPSPRRRALLVILGAGALLGLASPAWAQHRYLETDLVSDIPGLAAVTDPSLVNAWGLSRSATSPWWVADNGTGLSTLYTGAGAGAKLGLTVTIPTSMGATPPSAPTGTVFNASTTDFLAAPGKPGRFLFATENGTIAAWNSGTTAVTKVDWSGAAVYKGLTLGVRGTANFLYAANFFAGTVDVFDGNFVPVNLGPNAFRDWHLPKGYAPFNVQNIGGNIVVAFAKQSAEKFDEVQGPGNGFVDVFTPDGVLQMRLHGGRHLNAPWGLVQAPADFGRASNLLLVGQFGTGKIAAFDPTTGHFRGFLRGADHRSIVIDGLWALSFGNGGSAGPTNTLYFSAGIDDEAHGLFGSLTVLTDPVDNDGDQDCDDD